jgi:hypothetical protein
MAGDGSNQYIYKYLADHYKKRLDASALRLWAESLEPLGPWVPATISRWKRRKGTSRQFDFEFESYKQVISTMFRTKANISPCSGRPDVEYTDPALFNAHSKSVPSIVCYGVTVTGCLICASQDILCIRYTIFLCHCTTSTFFYSVCNICMAKLKFYWGRPPSRPAYRLSCMHGPYLRWKTRSATDTSFQS